MKQIQEKFPFLIKGMNQDNDVNSCDGSYSFENYNIRIDSSNHTYALVNEKGNKQATIRDKHKIIKDYIKCTILDSIVINDFIVLFVYNNDIELQDGDDNIPKSEGVLILKVNNSNDSDYIITSNIKYNFGINEKSNIEILATSENSDLYKVYFSVYNEGVGKRFIIHWNNLGGISNSVISADDFNILKYVNRNQSEFDITITNGIRGYLPTGTMQYFIRLSDKYGYATDFFWQSSTIYTIGHTTPNININCSYTIEIQMLNDDLNVEVYVAYASSISNTPQIFDISKSVTIDETTYKYVFIDNIQNRVIVSDPFIIAEVHNSYYYRTSCNLKSTFFIGNVNTKTFKKPKNLLEGITPNITQDSKFFNIKSGIDSVYEEGKSLNSNINPNYINGNRFFHNREHYRLGIQAMSNNGNWSSVVYLKDYTINGTIQTSLIGDNRRIFVPIINWDGNTFKNYRDKLLDEGFIAIRPVVIYPNIYQRKVLAQGVCNPTVYRYTDRINNEIWSQASWIWRPMKISGTYANLHINNPNLPISPYLYDIVQQDISGTYGKREGTSYVYSRPQSTAEFRHLHVLPNTKWLNSEIINNDEKYYSKTGRNFSKESKDLYGIDCSIFTLHSPDIELSENITDEILNSTKFRIVGYVPITSKHSNIDLTFETAPQDIYNSQIHTEFKDGLYINNIDADSGTTDNSCMYWCDHVYLNDDSTNYIWAITDQGLSETETVQVGSYTFKKPNSYNFGMQAVSLGVPGNDNVLYPIFLFHKSGSYNNLLPTSNFKYSTIKYSIRAHYHYSEYSVFLSNHKLWDAENPFKYTDHNTGKIAENTMDGLGIFPPKIFNSTSLEYINIGNGYQYCGNIDTLATATYNIPIGQMDIDTNWEHNLGYSDSQILAFRQIYKKLAPYFSRYTYIKDSNLKDGHNPNLIKREHSEPTTIKYKTTKHIVVRLKNAVGYSWGLPLPNIFKNDDEGAVYDYSIYQNYYNPTLDTPEYEQYVDFYKTNSLKWDTTIQDVIQPVLQLSNIGPSNHILWLGELYRDNATFGESTEDILTQQQWVVAGPTYILNDSLTTIKWTEGDTYYSRYDCLKTYPYTENDMNQIVDILSFRCESRVNTDGYYDNNRTPERSLYARPQNHGLLNTAYSKIFDINNAVYLSDNSKELTDFPSSVFWSEQKLNGENADTWYNMTLANQLDLDGKYGKIIALESLENYVYVFQENAISRIYYDTREAVTTESGLSLTIANNKKVTGYDIVCYNVGVQHYKSITNTGSLIYFVDSLRKIFYVFDGKNLVNISLKCGMKSWFNKHIEKDNDFYVFYEYLNNEVYIENTKYCIVYNENSASFTSLYPYYNIKHLHNINGKIITYKSDWSKDNTEENKSYPWSKIYKHFDGDYNIFYDDYEPYYIDLFCAPKKINMQDSVFTSLEYVNEVYNKDTYIPDITYSHISVGVPYYDTMEDLEELHYSKYGSTFTRPYLLPNGQYSDYVNDDVTKGLLKDSYNKKPYTYKSNLQKKFGIWRAELPRPKMAIDSNPTFRQNRLSSRLSTNYVRYPWVRIKLYNKPGDTRKSILHNLNVVYYN